MLVLWTIFAELWKVRPLESPTQPEHYSPVTRRSPATGALSPSGPCVELTVPLPVRGPQGRAPPVLVNTDAATAADEALAVFTDTFSDEGPPVGSAILSVAENTLYVPSGMYPALGLLYHLVVRAGEEELAAVIEARPNISPKFAAARYVRSRT